MDLKIGIIGAAESGIAAAVLAKENQYDVFVSDYGYIKKEFKKELLESSIHFEENGHSYEILSSCDLIIKSPGVPNSSPIIRNLKSDSISVISEIEFAFRHQNGTVIGITGSNGKSTTTSLIHHILKNAKKQAYLCGNIGVAFSRVVEDNPSSIYIVEVSSFQLDDVAGFRPDIAILTNITPDHLDRYNNDIKLYANAKFQIATNQNATDIFIYNGDDACTQQYSDAQKIESKKIAISPNELSNYLVGSNNNKISSLLQGKHNDLNTAFAIACCRELGIDQSIIEESIKTFKPIEHRLELFAEIDGVRYINDSKATNIDAVFYALDGVEGPLIWIVGGEDKGNDYTILADLVKEKVKGIVILSKHQEKIKDAFSDLNIPIHATTIVQEAVDIAKNSAQYGDAILLSPACASFDLFENYEDRGNQFKNLVLEHNEVI